MHLYRLLYPLLSSIIAPELAHNLTLKLLSKPAAVALLRFIQAKTDFHYAPQDLWKLHYRNPIGLAAGLDKNAEALPAWEALGFGYIEIGTITPQPQEGNPRPRLFRVAKERALINRMGFPNIGAEAVAARLHRLEEQGHRPTIPIGINIGKNKTTPLEDAAQDYASAAKILHPYADTFTLNISSPNTPGLRLLQTPDAITEIITATRIHTDRPLIIKLAPDIDHTTFLHILDTCAATAIEGIALTNTLLTRPPGFPSEEKGGISGRPLHRLSLSLVRAAAEHLAGTPIKIIGIGGIENLSTLQSYIEAGAHLVQIYTGLIYEGPHLLRHIARHWPLSTPPVRREKSALQ